MKEPTRGLCAALLLLGCGQGQPSGSALSASARASAPPAAPGRDLGPAPVAICDQKGPLEHNCFEYFDEELVRERARACQGGQQRGPRCDGHMAHSRCRLSDGTLRYTYPPKTPAQAERACKEARGKYATMEGPPPSTDPPETVSCQGKLAFACEEEESLTEARVLALVDECKTFGGTPQRKGTCRGEGAVGLCDLEGKRTIVFFPDDTPDPEDPDARRKFCEERFGKYEDLATAAASASASAAAPP